LLLELAGRPPDRLLEPGRPLADDPPKPLELPAEERTPDCPPKLKPILAELCGSFEYGHLHPDCPPEKVGRFRCDFC
jgi:hypothetical protein